MTISAGIALYPYHADDLHSLKKQADIALYRSKYNGSARVDGLRSRRVRRRAYERGGSASSI